MGDEFLGTLISCPSRYYSWCFPIGIYFSYASLSTLNSKQNQAPKYKQNVDELIRPHPGCLVLPLVTDKPDVHV